MEISIKLILSCSCILFLVLSSCNPLGKSGFEEDIVLIRSALKLFSIESHRIANNNKDIKLALGGLTFKMDRWGNEYIISYKLNFYEVRSSGADEILDTKDDLFAKIEVDW